MALSYFVLKILLRKGNYSIVFKKISLYLAASFGIYDLFHCPSTKMVSWILLEF
jgi:hypothetical protein